MPGSIAWMLRTAAQGAAEAVGIRPDRGSVTTGKSVITAH
jgi:hypothetical protein